MLQNFTNNEVWPACLVSVCRQKYPAHDYDNFVAPEWTSLNFRDVQCVWTFYVFVFIRDAHVNKSQLKCSHENIPVVFIYKIQSNTIHETFCHEIIYVNYVHWDYSIQLKPIMVSMWPYQCILLEYVI